ncbi:MAG: enoyl-CoA hydratase-related protein [Clostridiales bacterium]
MGFILYEKKGFVGLLTINRPEAFNALNSQLIMELEAVLDKVACSDIRCLIVTGAGGKAFVAGADITEMKNLSIHEALVFSNAGNAMMEKLENLPMPVIAAINGYALGGGCEIALACDIRIAAENAVFGLPETSLGILPGYGGIQRMVRTLGLAKTKELIFTTDKVSAEVALVLGLVNAVIPAEELMGACMEMADKIAANAPLAVRLAKKVTNRSVGLSLEQATRLECQSFADCFGTEDQRQAMTAFVEKRKPGAFTGRRRAES